MEEITQNSYFPSQKPKGRVFSRWLLLEGNMVIISIPLATIAWLVFFRVNGDPLTTALLFFTASILTLIPLAILGIAAFFETMSPGQYLDQHVAPRYAKRHEFGWLLLWQVFLKKKPLWTILWLCLSAISLGLTVFFLEENVERISILIVCFVASLSLFLWQCYVIVRSARRRSRGR